MDPALIIAAHGSSKDPRINRPLQQLAESISIQLGGKKVVAAFLDGTPDIRSIASEIEQDELLVIPLMASQGYYTDIVFPKVVVAPGKKVTFAGAIGAHQDIAPMVAARIKSLALGERFRDGFTIVIVGHGTRKNRKSCLTTIRLVQQLRSEFPAGRIEFAFIDQNPGLDHVVSNLTAPNAVVLPFLMGLGPHTTADVPVAFGIGDFGEHVFKDDFAFPFVAALNQRHQANERLKNVLYDLPIGIYPEIATLCVKIYRQHLATKKLEESYV